MKSVKSNLQVLLLVCAVTFSTQPLAKNALSANQIMEKVDQATRRSFTAQIASVKITTCKYTAVNGNVRCSDKPRIVVAENAKKVTYVNSQYNDRSLLVLREPVSDKGTGLLIYEYGERGRDNDNWLYLPALGKINRIIASDDEGGSVFGSEFSVETTQNPEARKIYDYTYKILDNTTYQGRPVWVIEMLPTPQKAKKTSYNRLVSWIDNERYLVLKEEYYRNGKVHKQRTQSDIKQIDGVYVVTKVVMNNLSTSRISQMHKTSMRHNADVPDEYLTQRALTDFAFRERNLAKFRAELNR